jgi:hypothetical protein
VVEFWTAVHVILRRWYVVVACGVVFALLAIVVVKEIKPSYQVSARTVVVQTGQPTATTAQQVNPYGSVGNFTQDVADYASAQPFANAFFAAGGSDYSVAPSISNSTLLLLTTTASTPEGAASSMKVLDRQLRQLTVSMQNSQHTPAATRYGLGQTSANDPVQLVGSRTKALLALGIVGLLVTLAAVFLVDGLLQARDRRRSVVELDDDDPSIRPPSAAPDDLASDSTELDEMSAYGELYDEHDRDSRSVTTGAP